MKDREALTRAVKEQGWDVKLTRGGHTQFVAPSGRKVTTASTPSDWRSTENTKHQLKRAGLDLKTTTDTGRERRMARYRKGGASYAADILDVLQASKTPLHINDVSDRVCLTARQTANALFGLERANPDVIRTGRGTY